MHIPKSYFSEYFKKSVLHLGKSKFIFFILTSIELIELTTNLIDKTTVLFRHNQVFNYKVSKLSTIVLTISPYHHFFHYMKQNITGDFTGNVINSKTYASGAGRDNPNTIVNLTGDFNGNTIKYVITF